MAEWPVGADLPVYQVTVAVLTDRESSIFQSTPLEKRESSVFSDPPGLKEY